ncbi:hypothetical protein B0T18DRAFT_409628 [Schizothecium vesticola]|uniref:Uncharacterized protein n=1 Tax=Schizothecium vesticola TaxID=314040 RepID=A0AA40ETZ0_9PEZI|nr:hypothetical protein B0T18DRAFT_409628 [Schizothecium vesticola]
MACITAQQYRPLHSTQLPALEPRFQAGAAGTRQMSVGSARLDHPRTTTTTIPILITPGTTRQFLDTSSSSAFRLPFQKLGGQNLGNLHCSMPTRQNPRGGHENFSRVRSHLFRRRNPAPWCKNCWAHCSTEEAAQQHQQQTNCSHATALCQEALMTPELTERIKGHRFTGTDEEKWYLLFRLLFPSIINASVHPYYEAAILAPEFTGFGFWQSSGVQSLLADLSMAPGGTEPVLQSEPQVPNRISLPTIPAVSPPKNDPRCRATAAIQQQNKQLRGELERCWHVIQECRLVANRLSGLRDAIAIDEVIGTRTVDILEEIGSVADGLKKILV